MTPPKGAVLITGASGGIGQALVGVFAEAGYSVIASDICMHPGDLACECFVAADLRRTVEDADYAESIFADIRRRLSGVPLRALVNNAAVQILAGVGQLSRADWRDTLEVNLLAPFFWTQAFLPELEAASGCVVNISSIHARLSKPGFSAYATSKAALSGLTRSMAVELGQRIRVNAIEPAAIDTPMLRAGFAKNPERLRQLQGFHPANCIGSPEKLGQLCKMVVEFDSLFLNGATLSFDGGIGVRLHDPGNGDETAASQV